MKFDLILTNPPFHDPVRRKKTPHKLWIDFTLGVFCYLLKEGGSLVQVSPSSFSSPSNVVLDLMTRYTTHVLRLGTGHHFPDVASTFSDYWIEKKENDGTPTRVVTEDEQFEVVLDNQIAYLPNDASRISLSIHRRVMFTERPRLPVEWDYVTAHNIKRYGPSPTLVEEHDADHPYPVFHTNRTIWWSSIKQEWADARKVMWTRSGYTKPFYDPGKLGGTDMVYFVRVRSDEEGQSLAHNLNSALFRYIFRTAKWSGFGNERVFTLLPDIPRSEKLTDDEIFSEFGLTREEVEYVRRFLENRRRKT